MFDEVNINVGGTLFITKWSTLKRFQDTRLGGLSTSSEYYNAEKKYFFFDRNPEFFNTILDFYRNGHIHFPTNICGWIWKQELEFWNIPVHEISECCFPTYNKFNKDKEVTEYLKNAFALQTAEYITKDVSCLAGIQQRVWLFLDEPTSSIPARLFSILYLAIVIFSAVVPMLATHPNIRQHVVDLDVLLWWVQMNGFNLWINTENAKEVMFVTTKTPIWLNNIELTIIVFFSIESILRFLSCPKKCKFFKDWLNILDVILFFAMWSYYIIEQRYDENLLENFDLMVFYAVCYSVVAFRLLRFFRITKQYSGLRILLISVKKSLKELLLLVIIFGIFVLLFSNLIYFAELGEPSTFPDMTIGLWWTVVTMTTVGYGDVAPVSALGRVVGSLCAMCGLLLLAMPIAVIAGKFNDLYKTNEEREDYAKLHRNDKCSSFWERIKGGKIFTVTRKINVVQKNNTNISTIPIKKF